MIKDWRLNKKPKLEDDLVLFTYHKDSSGNYIIRHYLTPAELVARVKARKSA